MIGSRYLITPDGQAEGMQMPGVTSITGQYDKSRVLMAWATKLMMEWLHKKWPKYVTEDGKKGNFIEFNEKEDYFKMLEDAKAQYKEVSDEAKDIGTQVHDLIHEYIKSVLDKTHKFEIKKMRTEIENGYLAFKEWEKVHVIKHIATELPVYSEKYGYATMIDWIVELKESKDIKGGIYVLDFKASKGFYDGYGMQVAAGRKAREENNKFHLKFKDEKEENNVKVITEWERDMDHKPLKIDGIGVLRLDKETGKPEFKDYSDEYDRKFAAFVCLRTFYYFFKNRRLKNNPHVIKEWDIAK